METLFSTHKDILDVVFMPLLLALLAIFYPLLINYYRRKRFKSLILRELQEIAPHPLKMEVGNNDWTRYQKKRCLHEKIFEDSTGNRDFILSLPPDLAYKVSNLWHSKKENSSDQWVQYLDQLSKTFDDKELKNVYDKWKYLIIEIDMVKKHHLGKNNPDFSAESNQINHRSDQYCNLKIQCLGSIR